METHLETRRRGRLHQGDSESRYRRLPGLNYGPFGERPRQRMHLFAIERLHKYGVNREAGFF